MIFKKKEKIPKDLKERVKIESQALTEAEIFMEYLCEKYNLTPAQVMGILIIAIILQIVETSIPAGVIEHALKKYLGMEKDKKEENQ